MRSVVLKAIAICIMCITLSVFTSEALGAFAGCPDWCHLQNRPGRGNLESYHVCMERTKKEGRCGPPASVPTPTPRPDPAPAQQVSQPEPPALTPTGPAPCVLEYTTHYQNCEHEIQQTASECDEENNSGMVSATDSMTALALALGNRTGGSIQAACSKMANVSQLASAALAAYRNSCNGAINKCVSTCETYRRFVSENLACLSQNFVQNSSVPHYTDASLLARTCQNYTSKPEHAEKAIANFGATAANASQCAKLTDGRGPQKAFCDANPQVVGCLSVDCTNPMIAEKNLICKCSANPEDQACKRGIASLGGVSSENSLALDQSSYRLGDQGADFSTDIPSTPEVPFGARPGDSTESLDGSQGNGSTVSGMGGSDSGSGGTQGSGNDESGGRNSDVYGGYANGGGRGGIVGGLPGGGSASAGGGYIPSRTGSEVKSPDLSKFLPRHNTMGGAVGLDGITGPHSNIWKKIRNRYQILDATLMK